MSLYKIGISFFYFGKIHIPIFTIFAIFLFYSSVALITFMCCTTLTTIHLHNFFSFPNWTSVPIDPVTCCSLLPAPGNQQHTYDRIQLHLFLQLGVYFSSNICWRLLSPFEWSWHPSWKSLGHKCEGLFLGSQYSFLGGF